METQHSERGGRPPKRNRFVRAYCWIMFVLLLYVLSTGPMYWTIYEAYHANGSPWIAALYYPVVLACEYEPVSRWFTWYAGLWIGI